MNKSLSVLVVGCGGREHALGWKLTQSPRVKEVFFAPGNGGTSQIGTNIDIGVDEIPKLVKWSKDNHIDLIVVGPEVSLAAGIVDAAGAEGLNIFGPSQQAAQLESSKAWADAFMVRHHIPHPQSQTFTNANAALKFVTTTSWPRLVLKASGLAGGKGVLLPSTRAQAKKAIRQIMIQKIFGKAGEELVIQEYLSGPEVSVLAFSDGSNIAVLLPTQDHKRALDQDQGLNTGGMGAYAPTPAISDKELQMITDTILHPTIKGMQSEGIAYKGVLYAGLMLTKAGPKVLEFNGRFGDPECQPLMVLLKTDLVEIMQACIDGTLDSHSLQFHPGFCACVVLTANGYPGDYKKGQVIKGLETATHDGVQVFHAGTIAHNGQVVTNGGRVLGITAYGRNVKAALDAAYGCIGSQGIHFADMHYRRDIGQQALQIK